VGVFGRVWLESLSLIVAKLRATMAPGERSGEVWLWYTAVYEAIQEIPQKNVTSYGHIARLVGKRELYFRMTKTTR
jgi:hypothetical protein